MKVVYFALLRDATGKNEEEWRAPAATVRELLLALCKRYGERFTRWVMRDGALWSLVIVLVNGRDVRSLQGMDTPLGAGDTVVIFPPLGGG